MKKKIVSYILVFCMVAAIFPGLTVSASAASSQQDLLVAHARTHVGNQYNTLYDRGPFKYRNAWCAEFVQHCSEAAGLADIIPTSGCEQATNMAPNVVNNKGGKSHLLIKVPITHRKADLQVPE